MLYDDPHEALSEALRAVSRRGEGGQERPPVIGTADSRQSAHHPVYPGASTVRGTTGSRFGRAWGLTEYVLLTGERLRFIYSRHEPPYLVNCIHIE